MSEERLRVLVIGAHPDDADISAGGVAALYVQQGHTVTLVSVTNGDAGHHAMGGGEPGPGLLTAVTKVLASPDMDPGSLIFELTETIFIEDSARALLVLGDLRQLGVRLALDDFGSGYSSLSYLARLSLDIVKIDRGFVANIGHDPTNRAIVVAIMDLAHILGLAVVAEGVETQRQCDEITATGCQYAQGFFYATPLPASEIGALIGARLGLASAHSPASLGVIPTAS